jgi:predicted phosphodiesterase
VAILQLLSDAHLEHQYDKGERFLSNLDAEGVDVLVLAGDIASATLLRGALDRFCEVYPHVVYVAGNHEYYGSSPGAVTRILAKANSELDNFHWLDCKVKNVAGLRFVGGSLWFPKPDAKTLQAGKQMLNDFNYIQGFEPWVYEENARCQAVLNAVLKPSNSSMPGADVVVTHHIPSWACTSPRFRGSSIDHYFTADQGELLENSGVPLWVFGHTHDRTVKRVGDTMLVCNALGYPSEREIPERGAYLERCLINVKRTNGQVTFPNGQPGGGW